MFSCPFQSFPQISEQSPGIGEGGGHRDYVLKFAQSWKDSEKDFLGYLILIIIMNGIFLGQCENEAHKLWL